MLGTDGADTLIGTADNDSIYGAGGNDLIQGMGGADVLVGQDGDDTLYGGDGNDYLVGGAGNDVLFGGEGVDWADYTGATSGVTIDLNNAKAQDTHGDGVDTLISIERVYGSAFGDLITGGNYDNLLSGGDGADTLSGGNGRDSLIGGGGDDVLQGGSGLDYFEGGAGNDTYIVNGKAEQVVEAADGGVDTVVADFSYHLGADVENLTMTGAGRMDGWGNELNNIIIGGDGANHLYGGGGLDSLSGGGGADTLEGGAHATLDGGDGDDLLICQQTDSVNGGGGNDTIVLHLAGRTDIQGGAGVDTLDFKHAASCVTFNEMAGTWQDTPFGALRVSGVEKLIGSSYDDAFVGSGANDVLAGGDGDDRLTAVSGHDTLIGGKGSDWFSGLGNATASGGGGIDTASFASLGVFVDGGLVVDLRDRGVQHINGDVTVQLSGIENVIGSGQADHITADADVNGLTGGGGADIFSFTMLADLNGDTITDLGADDTVDLSGIDANANKAGDQHFHLADAFSGAAGEARLTYDAAKDATYVDLDVNGDKVSDATLTLLGNHLGDTHFQL